MGKGNRLTLYIILAMILGIVVGYIIHLNASAATQASFSTNIKLLSTILSALSR